MLSESGTRYDWLPTQIQHHKDQNQDEHCVYQGFFLSKDLGYIVEVLRGQQIKLNHANSNSEYQES